MDKYIVVSSQGTTLAPDGEECDNDQILGYYYADDPDEALNKCLDDWKVWNGNIGGPWDKDELSILKIVY